MSVSSPAPTSIAERRANLEATKDARLAKAEKREKRSLSKEDESRLLKSSTPEKPASSEKTETSPRNPSTHSPAKTPSRKPPAAFAEAQSLLKEISSYVVHNQEQRQGSPRIFMSRSAAVTEDAEVDERMEAHRSPPRNARPIASTPSTGNEADLSKMEAENEELRRRLDELERKHQHTRTASPVRADITGATETPDESTIDASTESNVATESQAPILSDPVVVPLSSDSFQSRSERVTTHVAHPPRGTDDTAETPDDVSSINSDDVAPRSTHQEKKEKSPTPERANTKWLDKDYMDSYGRYQQRRFHDSVSVLATTPLRPSGHVATETTPRRTLVSDQSALSTTPSRQMVGSARKQYQTSSTKKLGRMLRV